MITTSIIQEIKSRINLKDFVSQHISLNRQNKGVCPFHSETHPSFVVNPEKQYWHCFGCGKSGDIFTFVQLLNRLTFSDAVSMLADIAGVCLPKSERFKRYLSRKWEEKKKVLRKIDFWKDCLRHAEIERCADLRAQRRQLPKKDNWDSWDSHDYLKEQLIDAKFEGLDQRMRELDEDADRYRMEVING